MINVFSTSMNMNPPGHVGEIDQIFKEVIREDSAEGYYVEDSNSILRTLFCYQTRLANNFRKTSQRHKVKISQLDTRCKTLDIENTKLKTNNIQLSGENKSLKGENERLTTDKTRLQRKLQLDYEIVSPPTPESKPPQLKIQKTITPPGPSSFSSFPRNKMAPTTNINKSSSYLGKSTSSSTNSSTSFKKKDDGPPLLSPAVTSANTPPPPPPHNQKSNINLNSWLVKSWSEEFELEMKNAVLDEDRTFRHSPGFSSANSKQHQQKKTKYSTTAPQQTKFSSSSSSSYSTPSSSTLTHLQQQQQPSSNFIPRKIPPPSTITRTPEKYKLNSNNNCVSPIIKSNIKPNQSFSQGQGQGHGVSRSIPSSSSTGIGVNLKKKPSPSSTASVSRFLPPPTPPNNNQRVNASTITSPSNKNSSSVLMRKSNNFELKKINSSLTTIPKSLIKNKTSPLSGQKINSVLKKPSTENLKLLKPHDKNSTPPLPLQKFTTITAAGVSPKKTEIKRVEQSKSIEKYSAIKSKTQQGTTPTSLPHPSKVLKLLPLKDSMLADMNKSELKVVKQLMKKTQASGDSDEENTAREIKKRKIENNQIKATTTMTKTGRKTRCLARGFKYNEREKCFTTTSSYYSIIAEDDEEDWYIMDFNEEDLLPSTKSQSSVEVPRWREFVYKPVDSNPVDMEEEDDEESYKKRHSRHEHEEKRRKRWDAQNLREQSYLERLKQRMEYKELQQLKKTRRANRRGGILDFSDDDTECLHPRLEDAQFIRVAQDLPIQIFGHPLPYIKKDYYQLPWPTNELEEAEDQDQPIDDALSMALTPFNSSVSSSSSPPSTNRIEKNRTIGRLTKILDKCNGNIDTNELENKSKGFLAIENEKNDDEIEKVIILEEDEDEDEDAEDEDEDEENENENETQDLEENSKNEVKENTGGGNSNTNNSVMDRRQENSPSESESESNEKESSISSRTRHASQSSHSESTSTPTIKNSKTTTAISVNSNQNQTGKNNKSFSTNNTNCTTAIVNNNSNSNVSSNLRHSNSSLRR